MTAMTTAIAAAATPLLLDRRLHAAVAVAAALTAGLLLGPGEAAAKIYGTR